MDIKEFTKKFGGVKFAISSEELLKDLKQLEESYVVEIEHFIADWINYCHNTGVNLKQALEVDEIVFYNYANQKDYKKLHEFMKDEGNQETFAQAWMFGYTIKEARYIVKLKGVIDGTKVLKHNLNDDAWYMGIPFEAKDLKDKHTKRELEAGGFGGVFNNPMFEVVEEENE